MEKKEEKEVENLGANNEEKDVKKRENTKGSKKERRVGKEK